MNNFYSRRTCGVQGVVIEEDTGRTVAVAYDYRDGPILAAGPALYERAKSLIGRWDEGDDGDIRTEVKMLRRLMDETNNEIEETK